MKARNDDELYIHRFDFKTELIKFRQNVKIGTKFKIDYVMRGELICSRNYEVIEKYPRFALCMCDGLYKESFKYSELQELILNKTTQVEYLNLTI